MNIGVLLWFIVEAATEMEWNGEVVSQEGGGHSRGESNDSVQRVCVRESG